MNNCKHDMKPPKEGVTVSPGICPGCHKNFNTKQGDKMTYIDCTCHPYELKLCKVHGTMTNHIGDKCMKCDPTADIKPVDAFWYYLMYAPESNEDRVKYWEAIKDDVEKLFEDTKLTNITTSTNTTSSTKPKDEWEEAVNRIIVSCDNVCCVECALDRKELKALLSQAEQRGRDEMVKDMRIKMQGWHGHGLNMVNDYVEKYITPGKQETDK